MSLFYFRPKQKFVGLSKTIVVATYIATNPPFSGFMTLAYFEHKPLFFGLCQIN
jgi:hypothetical protein